MTLLLLSCCKRKKRGKHPAGKLYKGAVFTLSMKLARQQGWDVMILSAKYGFVSEHQVISSYDKFMEKVYDGDWPSGKGYFIGGRNYFSNVPKRFKRIIPDHLRAFQQIAYIHQQLDHFEPLAPPRLNMQDAVDKLLAEGTTRQALYQTMLAEYASYTRGTIEHVIQTQLAKYRRDGTLIVQNGLIAHRLDMEE